MNKILSILILFNCMMFASPQPPLLNFIKSVDWEFMGDKTEFSLDLCSCDVTQGEGAAGFKATLAEPIGMVESTNTPWNIVSIGTKFDKSLTRKQGNSRNHAETRRYNHFIAIAPLGLLNFVQDAVCFERFSSLSFLFFSEIIPTQTNDLYALFTQGAKGPLSKIWYNNPVGALACSVDCAATTFDYPINSLHWCAGCAGATGNNTAYGVGKAEDPIIAGHVQAYSVIDELHYAGALAKVSNATYAYAPVTKISDSMCRPAYFPLAIKTQYRFQLAYPSVWDATTIGKNPALWAHFKNRPGSEDDTAFWIWNLKDTCIGAAKCQSMFTKAP